MKCPKCGFDVGESRFCTKCGTKIPQNTETAVSVKKETKEWKNALLKVWNRVRAPKSKKQLALIIGVIIAAAALIIAIAWGTSPSKQPHIEVTELNTTRGSNAVQSEISHQNTYFQLGFDVCGNFTENKTLKYRIIYPDGHVTDSSWTWDNVEPGENCGIEFDNGFGNHWLGDTIIFEIVDVVEDEVIGTIEVKIGC